METDLILANVGAISALAAAGVTGLLVGQRGGKLKRVFFWLLTITVVWNVLFMLGVNAPTEELGWWSFHLTTVGVFLAAAVLHLTLTVFYPARFLRLWILIPVYLPALALFGWGVWQPTVYIAELTAVNGLTGFSAGPYLWLVVGYMALLFLAVAVILVVTAVRAWRAGIINTRDKAWYCLLAASGGGLCLISAYAGAFNQPITLIPAAWLSWSVVFWGYGAIKSRVLDFRRFLKHAAFYLVLTGLLSAVLIILTDISFQLRTDSPDFPWWLLPSTMVVALVATGGIIWHRLREAELLKYEFVSIITHKFRTPLTRIKWSVGMLRAEEGLDNPEAGLKEIDYSVQKLVELTNLLVNVRQVESLSYRYNFQLHNLTILVREVVEAVKVRVEKKSLELEFTYDNPYHKVQADKQRLIYALQILFENAISYTPGGGRIEVQLKRREEWVIFSITDSGIGLSSEELNQIFTRFYRTPKAKLMDTEGAGVGLYMARQIVERHGGQVWVDSPGPNRGSTFYIKLPVAE